MKRTPFVTLLAGLALGAVLLGASMIASSKDAARQDAANTVGATTATANASPSAAASPSPTAPAAKVNATWAGTVNGGAATIAISVREGIAVAYLCDGKRVEAWLQGTAAEGKLNLSGPKGATLSGTFGNGKAAGTATAGGKSWTFTAPAVTKPSGLYRAVADVRNAKVVGGWIVLPDGRQVGVVTTDGAAAPAPALDLATGTATVDGTAITAKPVEGSLD
jgi:serine/threonine-protein kinase